MTGPLALVGGAELQAGNEEQDRFLIEHARRGPACVLVTANRKHPDMALSHARRWFASLGLKVEELSVRSRADAERPETVERARQSGFFYLVGGNPAAVVETLKDSPVWAAMAQAWREGAALGGSSAGAMALARWCLLPDSLSSPREALDLVHGAAVLPHYDGFGRNWVDAARQALGPQALLLGLDERTALVHHGGHWRAMGPGGVTVWRGQEALRAARGATVSLPDPG